jgi:hypothetical protein
MLGKGGRKYKGYFRPTCQKIGIKTKRQNSQSTTVEKRSQLNPTSQIKEILLLRNV